MVSSARATVYSIQRLVKAIRSVKQLALGLPPSATLRVSVSYDGSIKWPGLKRDLEHLAGANLISEEEMANTTSLQKTVFLGEEAAPIGSRAILRVAIPPEVDLHSRQESVEKSLRKKEKELDKGRRQADNPEFKRNADSRVVSDLLARINVLEGEKQDLEEALQQIDNVSKS
jgi:valyl-tRNA synthetase